jgi:methylamine dehydrogenase heavy chain
MKHFAFCVAALLSATTLLTPSIAAADLSEETVGDVLTFNRQDHDRLVWVTDMNSPYQAHSRAYLLDPNEGRFLGMLDLGYWTTGVQLSPSSDRIISPETHFSRTTRGERTDVVVSYDAITLQPVSEIEIPAKRASVVKMQGSSSLSDDARFMAQINFTPANSLTIVDLASGTFVGETDTPGCANVYGGGERSFHLVCGDGSFLTLTLDDAGQVIGRQRSEALFDPFDDPISISGVRKDNTWYFATLAGVLHEFTMTETGVTAAKSWPLISEDEQSDEWSISGFQHLAVHETTNRLYLMTHQGPPEAFEDPGTHIWVFDIATQSKVDSFELAERSLSIAVSQDANPLLYAIGAHIPMPFLAQIWVYFTQGEAAFLDVIKFGLDIYQAEDGEYLRSVENLGHLPTYIQPW